MRTPRILHRSLLVALLVTAALLIPASPGGALVPGPPPLAASSNVQLLGTVPTGPALGIAFKDHYAFVTGPQGLVVLDIAVAAAPVVIGAHPLPHFENEDVTCAATSS